MTDIINIADTILSGKIEGMADLSILFGLPKSDQAYAYVKTKKLQRGTLEEQQDTVETTKRATLIQMEWGKNSEYEYKDIVTGKPLTYYLHPNPAKAGVNILEIPFDGQSRDITFPCFVSSGKLSGCVYAWFLLEKKIIFLHAGGSEVSINSEEDIEEKRCSRRADIFNGLRYCIVEGDRTELEKEPVNVYLSTEELLKKVQGLVKAGQIIYPADDEEKEDMGMIQTMSYRPQTGSAVGECLCIITKSDEGIKVSGMMTEKEYSTFKNRQGRILKVDESGNEIR